MPDRLFLVVGGLFAIGALLMFLAEFRRGADRGTKRTDWIKYGIFLLLIFGLLLAAAAGRGLVGMILLVLAVIGATELARLVRPSTRGIVFVVGLGVLAAGLGHLLLGGQGAWRACFSTVVVLVAVTDSFSQLWGRLLGTHPLCPRLSPRKTVEGLAGGVATTLAVAVLLGFLEPGMPRLRLALIALATAAGAVAGDLAFSRIKRGAGVKDFSRLLPGHGGVLDRFDGLIVAAPVYYWAHRLLAG